MFSQLFEAQKKAEEIKSRLDNISVMGEVEGGKIKVVSTANKEIKDISIDDSFFSQLAREELEELLIVALNKALSQADIINKSEMEAATQDLLGGMGGLSNMFNK